MKISVKNKRGIPFPTHIVFSAVALLAQVVFFIVMVQGLREYSLWVNAFCTLLAIVTVLSITNKSGKSGYKILWIIFILAVPIFGVLSYMLLGGGRVFPHIKKKMHKCEQNYIEKLPKDTSVYETLKYSDGLHSRQADYLSLESGYPLYKNSSCEFLSPGEVFLPRFLEELQKAQQYIFIEYLHI